MKKYMAHKAVPVGSLVILLLSSLFLAGCELAITDPKESVSSIAVTALPEKTSYYVGEHLDPTGMVVTVKTSAGKTERIPWYANIGIDTDPARGGVLDTVGEQDVTVSYEGADTTFKVTVEKSPVASISLKDSPDTDYDVGEAFDPTGLSFTAILGDGTTEDIVWSAENDAITLYPAKGLVFDQSGDQQVEVLYKGAKMDISVAVYDVFMTGCQLVNDIQVAGYWKNGTFSSLGDGLHDSNAYAIAMNADGQIYAAGYQRDGSAYRGGYWKPDGTFVSLQSLDSNVDSTSYVTALSFTEDGTLLLGGYGSSYGSGSNGIAGIWNDDGLYRTLQDGVEDLHVSGFVPTDAGIYVGGDRNIDTDGRKTAVYWTPTGREVVLDRHDPGNTEVDVRAFGGAVDAEGMLYFAGRDGTVTNASDETKYTAVFWDVNGNETVLGDPDSGSSYAYGVVMIDDLPYIGGFQYYPVDGDDSRCVAGYWKPDTQSDYDYTFVPVGDFDAGRSFVRFMMTSEDDDIYLCGYQYDGDAIQSGYWKNDGFHALGTFVDGNSNYVTMLRSK